MWIYVLTLICSVLRAAPGSAAGIKSAEYLPRERIKSTYDIPFGKARVSLVGEFGVRCFHATLETRRGDETVGRREWCMSNFGFPDQVDPVLKAAGRSFAINEARETDPFLIIKVLSDESAFSGQFGLLERSPLSALKSELEDSYAMGSFEYPPYLFVDRAGVVRDVPARSASGGDARLYASADQSLFIETVLTRNALHVDFYTRGPRGDFVKQDHPNIRAGWGRVESVRETADHALVVTLVEPPGLKFGYLFNGRDLPRVIDPDRIDLANARNVEPVRFSPAAVTPKTIVRARPVLVGGIELDHARVVFRPLFASLFGRWTEASKLLDVDDGYGKLTPVNVTFDGHSRATLYARVDSVQKPSRLFADRTGTREITRVADLPPSLRKASADALLAPFLVTTTLDANAYRDPDGWHRAARMPAGFDQLISSTYARCPVDPRLVPDFHLEAVYIDKRQAALVILTAGEDCVKTLRIGGPYPAQSSPWRPDSTVILRRGAVDRRLSAGDTLVDAGDYDGDGASELIFLNHSDTEGVTSLSLIDAAGDLKRASNHVTGFGDH